METTMVHLPAQKSWLEAIAERASCEIQDVRNFVTKYNINQSPMAGSPKRMNLTQVLFSGKKSGLKTNDFEFNFDGLGPGMWGLLTDGNLKGKTTALEIIKWLFKGKVPSSLQAGVKSWIQSAMLSFSIDQTNYRILLTQVEDKLSGSIERMKNSSVYQIVAEFSGETEMENEISAFMLEQFELSEIASHRKGQDEFDSGSEVVHGWPALAAAMFIGTDYTAIFGDVANAGLPGRILKMYIGLPWIPTAAALKALEGNLNGAAAVEAKEADLVEQKQNQRLLEIRSELETQRNKRSSIVKPTTSEGELHKLLNDYNRAFYIQQVAEKDWIATKSLLDQVALIAKEDDVRLRNFLENKAANKVFKRINPKCCPHCDRRITTEDLTREQSNNTCSVCDHEMLVADDSEAMLIELQESARLSKNGHEQQRQETKDKFRLFQQAEKTCAEFSQNVGDYKERLFKDNDVIYSVAQLEREIYRLEILEAEYARTQSRNELKATSPSVDEQGMVGLGADENVILKAAIKETELRYRTLQEELFKDVSDKMLEYCSKVGLSQYKSLSINGTPVLKIDKDGLLTSYSKVSPGEKLRLKVIAVLALISIAEQKGYGRHPGFLIIDSPGAQEVNDENVHELILGLKELCGILPSLQIIIASKATTTLLELIDEEHRKYATGENYLW